MKRRVLCASVLVLWLLAACTALSVKIEEAMIPFVWTVEPSERSWLDAETGAEHREKVIPLDSLIRNETGAHLFRVWQGSGWESGFRVMEARPDEYTPTPVGLQTSGFMDYVEYATKEPVSGEQVTVVERPEKGDDRWLLVYPPETALPEEYPAIVTPVEISESAALYAVQNVTLPFMPGKGLSTVFYEDENYALFPVLPDGTALYSLSEAERFLRAFPLVGLLIGLILSVAVVWAGSCVLSRHARRARSALFVNAGWALLALGGLWLLLTKLDLPSSLLPKLNILEFKHYGQELSVLFDGLQSLTAGGAAERDALFALAASQRAQGLLWAALLPALGACLLLGEFLFLRRFRPLPKAAPAARRPARGRDLHRALGYVPRHADWCAPAPIRPSAQDRRTSTAPDAREAHRRPTPPPPQRGQTARNSPPRSGGRVL